jgi:hypothetical protein
MATSAELIGMEDAQLVEEREVIGAEVAPDRKVAGEQCRT